MPKVDIIIPAYNAARYLATALESVIAQTFEEWRILLVDDGSTDNTAEIVRPYADRLGSRLHYIHQTNQGLPAARNTAIRHSSAEFLALLDADDVWLPWRLEESVRRFENHPEIGLVYGCIARIDPLGNVLDTFTAKHPHAEGHVAPYIYMRSLHLPCPTVTFRRSCVHAVGMFDESMPATEDRDLWVRIALCYEVGRVDRVIANYRTSPNAMTTDPERMLRAQLRFIQKHYGAPGCGFWARRVALSGVYRQRAEALASRTEVWPAVASALRATALYPFDPSNARTAGSLLLRSVFEGQ